MSYVTIKVLHVLAAFALVGPLILVPGWLYLYREKHGRLVLNDLHRLTSVAGWIVFLSGCILLAMLDGALLYTLWIQVSIFLFITVQVIDHFWADKKEIELENGNEKSLIPLRTWLFIKLGCYFLITFLMMVKVG